MIFTLRVECVRGMYWTEESVRVIEFDEEDSLYSLHYAINKFVDFDFDHVWDFYAGRHPDNRKVLFTETEGWNRRQNDYRGIQLGEVYPLPKSTKLYYFFDYGDSWIFEIRKARKLKEPEPGVEYPRVIERIGPNPEQYPHI